MLKSLPNLITLLRLFLVPAVVWLLLIGEVGWAFWTFVIAGILDGVDGALARLLDARTELGAYLDPLADKALLGAAFITMGISGMLPIWLVVMVVFRDLLIVSGVMLLRQMDQPVTIRPLYVSKVNTTMQIILIGAVLAKPALGIPEFGLTPILIGLAAATTVISALGYVYVWARQVFSVS